MDFSRDIPRLPIIAILQLTNHTIYAFKLPKYTNNTPRYKRVEWKNCISGGTLFSDLIFSNAQRNIE